MIVAAKLREKRRWHKFLCHFFVYTILLRYLCGQKILKKMKKSVMPNRRVSHLVKPDGLTLEEWQVMLRRQQAQREQFEVACVSEHDNPGEYSVRSALSGGRYKVVFRGDKSPWNYCDCMDFKTSQLGTCKHVEAVRQWIAEHGLSAHSDLPAYTSVYLSYRANERLVRIRIGTAREDDFRALASKYFDELGTLMPRAYAYFDDFLALAKAIDKNFRCYPDAYDFVVEQRETIARRKIIDERYTDEALDTLLRTSLYPYQKAGVRFAARAGRAILADEMGLGKTVQAIATAELLRREGFVGSVLILCPETLQLQWQREIERFAGHKDGYRIASYDSVEPAAPDMLILDEVQRLKNWHTQTAKDVRRITSRYTLILSAAPFENRMEDLYSLVELVDQFLLSPYYQFKDRYILTDGEGRTVGYRHQAEVLSRLQGVMLRRRRAEVADQLPARIDKQLCVPDSHNGADMKVEEVMNILEECGVMESDASSVMPHRTRVAIFSQSEQTTQLVAQELERSGVEFVYLHDDVSVFERQHRLDLFQTDAHVRVLLATDAGFEGLRLPMADVVIHLDESQEAAVMEQRVGDADVFEVIRLTTLPVAEEQPTAVHEDVRLRFFRALADLLMADEATRHQAAELLLKQK